MCVKEKTNHVLHLLLTLCTCSLWLIPWLVFGVGNVAASYRCVKCGTKV